MTRPRYYKLLTFLLIIGITGIKIVNATAWEDWELGGELGLGVGEGSERGGILSPALMITGTRQIENRSLELGLGYMFGTSQEVNYTEDDLSYPDARTLADAGKDVDVKINVIPMTVNFMYTIYDLFYLGAGIGLYHVFYRKEPLGAHKASPDAEPGETVSRPATTAIGFQQKMGMEVFPMSPNWNWFVGIQSFLTTDTPAGSLLGISFGGKVRYSW